MIVTTQLITGLIVVCRLLLFTETSQYYFFV